MNNASVEPLIVTRNLTRTYSQGRNKIIGIQDIDLDIHSDDIVIVTGDSFTRNECLEGRWDWPARYRKGP